MSADIEPDPGEKRPGALDYLRPIALLVIALASGSIVWAIHSGDVFLISVTGIFGGSLGLFAGLVAGVSLPDTMLTIGGITGLFEGIVRGFAVYGMVGAIVCGPLGFVAGVIVSIPLMMLLLLILCLGTGTGSGSGNEAKNE